MSATTTILSELGLAIPVLAAPMAGGPTSPELVIAAAGAGGLGFLAGGYKSADALADQLRVVRERTSTYGVNLFAPNPVPVDPADYTRYRDLLRVDADRLGVTLPDAPVEDDDQWRDKLDVLVNAAPPIVSFTFGIPDAGALSALRAAGSTLVQTVTSVEEARRAAAAGVDALAVQSSAAGGHSATLTPDQVPVAATPLPELLRAIGQAVPLPMIAAGGIAAPGDVASAIECGARAVMVGTVLLRSPESAASAVHRAALAEPGRGEPVVTRAFTGRPARGLRNTFIDAYEAVAPAGYPALHHLTRPLRAAAAAAGNPEFVNLWAGTGYRAATEQPAAEILRELAAAL